jgi:hypothetical protein
MRGVTVELPQEASNKLTELTMSRDSALDAARSAGARLGQLPADADARMRDRLASEQAKHQQRFGVLSQLLSRTNQFLMELRLPVGSELGMAPAVPQSGPRPGLTLIETIEATREEIAKLQRQVAVVRSAPLKRASQTEAINNYLARLARQARPKVGFDVRGNARVAWIEDLATMDSVLGLLAVVLGSEQIAAAFTRQFEQEPEPVGALSPAERDNRLADLAASLLLLERQEEQLIERAAADGTEVLRRSDASPLAVLGITAVAKEAAQQVA